MIPPYPLLWPEGQTRSRPVKSQFRTELPGAMKNVAKSLTDFGYDSGKKVEDVQITSNASLTSQRPDDCGIAVWFKWAGAIRCIAVDRYDKIACNLQAVHHCIEADRTKLRHGGIHMVSAQLRAHAALPAPTQGPGCWTVLGITPGATEDEIKAAYRRKIRETANEDDRMPFNVARDQAIKEITNV